MDVAEKLITGGLYKEIDLSNSEVEDLEKLISVIHQSFEMIDRDHFDIYCKECQKESVFRKENVDTTPEGRCVLSIYGGTMGSGMKREKKKLNLIGKTRNFTLELSCSRNVQHRQFYYFNIFEGKIQKVGQFPSLISSEIKKLRKYEKILDKEKYNELTRAIGLEKHGVGIGSFVYLRRIIEEIIEEAHSRAKNEEGWNDINYQNSKTIERIKLLKDFLPKIFIQNAHSYSILSKGIHDLNEQECQEYFPPLRDLIFLILEEKLSFITRESSEKKVSTSLSKINSKIKSQ